MDVLLDGRTQLALNSLLQLAFPALSMKEASPCSSYFLTQPRRLRPDSPFDLVICRSDPLPERYSRALASIQSAACFLLAIKNPPKAVWLFTLSALGGSYHIVAGVFLFAEGPTSLPSFGSDLGKLFFIFHPLPVHGTTVWPLFSSSIPADNHGKDRLPLSCGPADCLQGRSSAR